jgi:hypothetical protein
MEIWDPVGGFFEMKASPGVQDSGIQPLERLSAAGERFGIRSRTVAWMRVHFVLQSYTLQYKVAGTCWFLGFRCRAF